MHALLAACARKGFTVCECGLFPPTQDTELELVWVMEYLDLCHGILRIMGWYLQVDSSDGFMDLCLCSPDPNTYHSLHHWYHHAPPPRPPPDTVLLFSFSSSV